MLEKYYFVDKNTSIGVIRTIAHMLERGSQIICSDFAAKALIFNWDQHVFGSKCPFVIIGTTSGSILVKYEIEVCKKCPFPQLAALSSVGIPECEGSMISSCAMDAMANTIIYGINPTIDESLDLKVYSVAVCKIKEEKKAKTFENTSMPPILKLTLKDNSGSDDFSYNESKSKEIVVNTPIENQGYDTKLYTSDIYGSPVHTVVLFKHFKGSLVVSSLHLSNLTDIRTNTEKVIESATLYLGPQRSTELSELLRKVSLQSPELVRSVTSNIVAEIAASAS